MKLPVCFVLVIVLGTSADYLPDLPDDPDITGFFENYGSGICEKEKMEQLKEQEQNCMAQANFFNATLQIQNDWNLNEWCIHLENILKCWDNYTECYNYEEMKELKATILEWTVEPLAWLGHELLGELKECPIYLELIDDDSTLDWIIMLIIGVVIILIIGICSAVQNFQKKKRKKRFEKIRKSIKRRERIKRFTERQVTLC